MQLKFTLQFDNIGRTSETSENGHIRDMIEQVLFTNPGERVNHPDFGCGLLQLVFQPNSDELSITTQYLVQSSLNRWLGDIIEVLNVEVENIESILLVTVVYNILRTQQRQVAQFTQNNL